MEFEYTLSYDEYQNGIGCKPQETPADPGLEPGQVSRKDRNFHSIRRMLEIQGKFPSSEMVQKPATVLSIDPTELFSKEIDPAAALKNRQGRACSLPQNGLRETIPANPLETTGGIPVDHDKSYAHGVIVVADFAAFDDPSEEKRNRLSCKLLRSTKPFTYFWTETL
jgi:hypothetical protein